MTRDDETKPQGKMARPQSLNSEESKDDIPKGEFIDVLSNQPVDPGRLQVFPVPQEFLTKALAAEPPRLSPEDKKDTAPRGLPFEAKPLRAKHEQPLETTPVSFAAQRDLSGSKPVPNKSGTVIAPSEASDTTMAIRRTGSAGLFARWAITGKVPSSVKVALGIALGVLILILAWAHWNTNTPDPETKRDAAQITGASVPLIAPPEPSIPTQVSPEAARAPADTNGTNAGTPARTTPADRVSTTSQEPSRSEAKATKSNRQSASSPSPASKPLKTGPTNPEESPSASIPNNNPPKKKAWFSED